MATHNSMSVNPRRNAGGGSMAKTSGIQAFSQFSQRPGSETGLSRIAFVSAGLTRSQPDIRIPVPPPFVKSSDYASACKLSSISAFFPAYNDGGTIASMVVSTLMTLRECADDYEVIVVDDGSADYTGELLDELARIHAPDVRVIHHSRNRGYGGALRSGFAAASKDWIFYTDGDAQYDPRELRLLVAACRDRDEQVDVINGYKISRSDPWYRRVIGRVYHHLVKFMFGFKLRTWIAISG